VLYGSNSGSSEAFARRMAGDAIGRGYAAVVAPLDEYAGKLPTTGALLVVTASYNGAPPDNARRFCEWLDSVPAGALSGLRYAVFGCGNRDWAATYQAIPTRIDERLAAAGAERLTARGEADARADFFGDFEGWYTPATSVLDGAFAVAATTGKAGALYELERVDSGSDALCRQHGVATATVLENRELVDMTSPLGRSKRHLQLQLPDGVRYRTGDYLVVLPENDRAQVERVARRFALATDRIVQLKATRAGAASLPTGRAITIGELLGRHVELATPATRQQVAALAQATQCPPEKMRLQALADDNEKYRAQILGKRVSVLDLLEEFLACELSFAAFLELVPAMRPRQYSISSSPLADPARCTLTVAVVDGPAWSGRGHYRGTASGHLARLQPGDTIAVSVRAPNTPFHPPADRLTPMILVAAGSGMAPFRGFVEERALGQGPAAETLLFFGCDHPDVDLLYRDELAAWQERGVVELLPAFFRAPDGDVMFVQHRLWKERARVQALLERGAFVFVCGDGARMAPAVRETLARIRQDATGCSDEEAGRWLDERERQGLYVADVFT
jgi:cytochrome P450/NADPH-cytochrome P450 reductase